MIKQTNICFIDEGTGEVISESTKSIKSAKSYIYDKDKGIMVKQRSYYRKIYADTGLEQIVRDDSDLLKLYKLIGKIYKNTNIIYYQASESIYLPAGFKEISEQILGLSLRKTKEFMKRMISLGIIGSLLVTIGECKYNAFAFNPVYVSSNKYVNKELYFLFKPYLDKYIPQWAKDRLEEDMEENND